MNLFDKHAFGSVVHADDGIELIERAISGIGFRGIKIPAGARIVIPSARRIFSFRESPSHCGWIARSPDGEARLSVVFTSSDRMTEGLTDVSPQLQAVILPWPKGDDDGDLSFSAIGGEVEIFVHQMMSRKYVLSLAAGDGVEVGPGNRPNILPSAYSNPRYLEKLTRSEIMEWREKSGSNVSDDFFDRYITGEASDLPIEPNSLDFIFGSHVLEHLANPLGHLAHWHSKLRHGGRVIAIVPELTGARDWFQLPSTLSEWQSEFSNEVWRPSAEHYARYYRCELSDKRVQAAVSTNKSIHVHFYTESNTADLLRFCCEELGYSRFDLLWQRNHKDFQFVLYK